MWLAWFLVSLASFGVLEYIAVTNDTPNDSLTRTIITYIPWVAALGVLIVAVIAAVWHWWKGYADAEPGKMPKR